MKLHTSLFVVLAAAAFAACSSNNSTPRTPASPVPLGLRYTAIGASDAVGYGASVPCTEASPALVADPTCPETGASGYVPDIRTDLAGVGFAAALQDLGISGAVIGPDIQADADAYSSAFGATPCVPRTTDAIPGNFITDEYPKIAAGTGFVTIFAGGNDVNAIVNNLACGAGGATADSQQAYAVQEITKFGNDFATLVGAVHQKFPAAFLTIANIPNFANVPYALALPASARGALQQISVAIDTNVINKTAALGIPVVDLQCDPESYDPANFYTDGFHPNDKGYALLAGKFVQQAFAAPAAIPQATCSEQGISGTTQGAARTAIPLGLALRLPIR